MRHLLLYNYINTIVKMGSIRKAADVLAITPSALNRRVQAFEEELGEQIFERLAKGVKLNVAGEILLKHIRVQLSDMERVRSQIADLSGLRRGHVTLASSPEISGQFLPNEIQHYQHQFPSVSFDIKHLAQSHFEQALVDHQADIALIFEPKKLADFQTTFSLQQPIMCVVPNTHPLAKKKDVRLYEYLEHPHIMPNFDWALRQIIESAAARLGLNPRPSMSADSVHFMRSFGEKSGFLYFDIPINLQGMGKGINFTAIPLNQNDVSPGFLFGGHLRGRSLPVAAARFLEQIHATLAKEIL